MALDSYANLKITLQSWLARADLANDVDDMIDMFEGWCNRNLRVPQMEQESTANATEYMPFPTDFMELRDIQYQSNPVVQLEYQTPVMADMQNPNGDSGTPYFYTIVSNQIRLVPAPDDPTVKVRIDYWKRLTPLSDSAPTNWLLDLYPDSYLYGSMVHGHVRIQDPQIATFIASGWTSVMQELARSGRNANVGSSLRIRAR